MFLLHLLDLLLLAALELILLPLIVGPLVFQFFLFLDVPLLHLLTLRILLLAHFFRFSLLFLLEPRINVRIIRWPGGRGTVLESASVICRHSLRAIRLPRIFGGAIRAAGSAGIYCATSVEFARTRSGCNLWTTMIYRGEQSAVSSGSFKMTILLGCHGEVMFTFGSQLLRCCASGYSAAAAIETDTAHMIVDNRRVVGVADHGDVHIRHGAVVVIRAASPVAGVPNIETFVPAPVAWSPEHANFRRFHPRARNPEVAVRPVSPVAGNP